MGGGGINLHQTGMCYRFLKFYHPVLGWENPESMPCSRTKNLNHISCSRVTNPSWKQNYVLCCVVLCCVVSCRVVSCRVVSCRVVSCRVVSCRVVSCRVVSCWKQRPHLRFIYFIIWLYGIPFYFCYVCAKNIKFPVSAVRLSHNICIAFQN